MLAILFVVSELRLSSQEIPDNQSIVEIIQNIYDPTQGGDIEELAELLSELAENPVEINTASEKELSRLFFLTNFQIKSILDHIKTTGPVVSLNELILIPGISETTARIITPFISLTSKEQKHTGFNRPVNKITLLWSHSGDKPDTSYLGQPWKSTLRYSTTWGIFSAGCTADKDSYEPLLTKKYKYPDFFSGWLAAEPNGIIKKIIAGDYTVRSSHGLALNSSSYSSFSLTSPGNLMGRQSARPYTSADENRFLRGLALTAGTGKLELTLFGSFKETDATLWYPPGSSQPAVSSFYTGGIHNNEKLLAKKDALLELTAGSVFSAETGNTRVTLTFKTTRLSLPVIPDRHGPDSALSFTGKRNDIFSAGYVSSVRRSLFSGEAAINERGAVAAVNSLQWKPDERLIINLMARYCSPGYHSLTGKIPGVSLSVFSGYAFYGGALFEAARHLFISAGTDLLSNHPSAGFRSGAAASRHSSEIKAAYSPANSFSAEVTLFFRKGMYGTPDDHIAIPAPSGYNSARLKIVYSPSESLKLSARADIKRTAGGSSGYLLLHEGWWRPAVLPLKVWYRYSLFSTGSFDSAIYAWENDMPYSYSVPPLYGTGRRISLLISTATKGKIIFSVKYSETETRVLHDRELKVFVSARF